MREEVGKQAKKQILLQQAHREKLLLPVKKMLEVIGRSKVKIIKPISRLYFISKNYQLKPVGAFFEFCPVFIYIIKTAPLPPEAAHHQVREDWSKSV